MQLLLSLSCPSGLWAKLDNLPEGQAALGLWPNQSQTFPEPRCSWEVGQEMPRPPPRNFAFLSSSLEMDPGDSAPHPLRPSAEVKPRKAWLRQLCPLADVGIPGWQESTSLFGGFVGLPPGLAPSPPCAVGSPDFEPGLTEGCPFVTHCQSWPAFLVYF